MVSSLFITIWKTWLISASNGCRRKTFDLHRPHRKNSTNIKGVFSFRWDKFSSHDRVYNWRLKIVLHRWCLFLSTYNATSSHLLQLQLYKQCWKGAIMMKPISLRWASDPLHIFSNTKNRGLWFNVEAHKELMPWHGSWKDFSPNHRPAVDCCEE